MARMSQQPAGGIPRFDLAVCQRLLNVSRSMQSRFRYSAGPRDGASDMTALAENPDFGKVSGRR